MFGGGALPILPIIEQFVADRSPGLRNLFVWEPIPEVFHDTEVRKRWEKSQAFFANHSIQAYRWGNPLDEVADVAAHCKKWVGPGKISLLALPYYRRAFAQFWEKLAAEFASRPSVNQDTIHKFTVTWTSQWCKNILDLTERKILTRENRPKNYPLIFTGASPRLETQVPWLREHRSCYYLLASDTSLGYLLDSQIEPDGVLSVDAGRGTLYHLMRDLPERTRIFTWLGGTREVFQIASQSHAARLSNQLDQSKVANPTQLSIFATNYPLDQLLLEWNGLPESLALSNPSLNVVGMAISLAELWCFPQVYLAGMGLRSHQRKTHCRSTGYESFYLPVVSRRSSLDSLYPHQIYRENVTSPKNQLTENFLTDTSRQDFCKILPESPNLDSTYLSPYGNNFDPGSFSPPTVSFRIPDHLTWIQLANRTIPGVNRKILASYSHRFFQ